VREPADDGRLRALLATATFGFDAAALAGLDTDGVDLRAWQDRLQQWQAQSRRYGPLAALSGALAAQAPRLLAQPGGERRLGNLLQVAEELQLAHANTPGLAALQAWLARRIADHDDYDEAEQLRLESDADCVRILTLHASKGLTLDLVFVPFASLPVGNGKATSPPMALHRVGDARIAVLYPAKDDPRRHADDDAAHAEAIRTLYVALTRARLATWIGWGAYKQAHESALGWLLHRSGGQPPAKLTAEAVAARLQDWLDAAPGSVEVERADAGATPPACIESAPISVPPAHAALRMLDRDWWVYSFSQLSREEAGAAQEGAADDEPEAPALPGSRFAGTRFGNVLHAALERVDFAAWDDWRGELPPPHQLEPLEKALRDGGFASLADRDEGVPLLTALVAQTLNAPLPEGVHLAALPADALGIEMEFHLAFAPVAVPALLAVLHKHGVLPDRRGFGLRAKLEGLLTGRIDLVYLAHGRWHVLDYKSNRLPGYGPEALARAVRDGEYDLQYVLYALALNRWMRFRLGAASVPERDFGGVRYLFCRGLDRDAAPGSASAAAGRARPGPDPGKPEAADPASPGVFAPDVPLALLRELDALLAVPES
jgi:exodeoxyribonuclease V beta subunit